MFNCAKKLLSLLLVLSLLLALPMTALAAEGDEKTISVSSAEDLLTLSESCKLDTWSEGVTVELEADVSLEGVAFSPIASFGGTFHGNGHQRPEPVRGAFPCGIVPARAKGRAH